MQHEKIANRILKRLNVSILKPSIKLRINNFSLQFKWDGIGKSSGNKLILVEVEPTNPNENHIRLHVVNLALLSYFKPNVEKLIWIVDAGGSECHKLLSLELKRWKKFLSRILTKELPLMEICDRSGKLLESF